MASRYFPPLVGCSVHLYPPPLVVIPFVTFFLSVLRVVPQKVTVKVSDVEHLLVDFFGESVLSGH